MRISDWSSDMCSSDLVIQACGTAPAGWFGQDQGESARTPHLISHAGFSYLADWPNDEQPYWMKLTRPIVSLPFQIELEDQQLMWIRQQPTWRDRKSDVKGPRVSVGVELGGGRI